MGLLERLRGWIRIVSFDIVFDEEGNVGANVKKHVPFVAPGDYVRLWAYYQAKMIYNLGYPRGISASMAIGAIAAIADRRIYEDTDCFREAHLDDVIRYAPEISVGRIRFTGEFYGKGSMGRAIKTRFPSRATDQQVVYSALALMQYAVSATRDDKEILDIFTGTARNMTNLYLSGSIVGIRQIVVIPNLAYMQAIGIAD